VGTVSPVPLSADAAWKYLNNPGAAAWRKAWRDDFDKPYRHLSRLFPGSRETLPSAAGIDGMLTFHQWAERLYGSMRDVICAKDNSVRARIRKWAGGARQ
jgi:hypothetical protein